MNYDLWKMIGTFNSLLLPLREAYALSTMATIDLVELRSQLRSQLEALRTFISERYSERDAYFVIFPLTAHCDEVVKMMILDTQHLEWPPLQQELYQVADAGDLFYELLDNALTKPDTLPLVYEAYYFCLRDGFFGRYSIHPDRVTDYLVKIQKHIRLQPITTSPLISASTKRSYFRIPNYSYYAGAGLVLVLIYFVLTFMASTWQPM
jgi:type IV/VI secretion system ImpK/VasF family protein